MGLKIILTGATGMVGEGVLLECLEHPAIDSILVVGRRSCGITHPKVTELLVPNFKDLDGFDDRLRGYDACLYCAGISSAGLSEADYTAVTYDTPMAFAQRLVRLNPSMSLAHVSGASTDATEQGRVMWARVKGKAENELSKLPFKRVVHFRPAFMRPTAGQKNVRWFFKALDATVPVMGLLFPNSVSTLKQVGQAMIQAVLKGAPKQVLEVPDIKALAATS